MELEAARSLARSHMDRHGLQQWHFRFNARKRTCGLCHHAIRLIELSGYFTQMNSEAEILDTILHEIAHALVGVRHGHNAVWKRKALELGCKPKSCADASVEMPKGRWQADCTGCGHLYARHRQPRRGSKYYCRPCGPERGKLLFTWR